MEEMEKGKKGKNPENWKLRNWEILCAVDV